MVILQRLHPNEVAYAHADNGIETLVAQITGIAFHAGGYVQTLRSSFYTLPPASAINRIDGESALAYHPRECAASWE